MTSELSAAFARIPLLHGADAGTARRLAGRNVIEMMEVEGGFLICETIAPAELVGKRMDEAGLRSGHGVTVVAIRHRDQAPTYADANTVIQDGDLLVVAGETSRVERFVDLR